MCPQCKQHQARKFIVVRFFFSFSGPGKTVYGSFNGSVALTCDHSHGPTQYVGWTYRDKYNNDTFIELIRQNGSASNVAYGANFTEERIQSWDYGTGNVAIDDLGCWDDQVYYCNVSAANDSTVFLPDTYYDLKLGER